MRVYLACNWCKEHLSVVLKTLEFPKIITSFFYKTGTLKLVKIHESIPSLQLVQRAPTTGVGRKQQLEKRLKRNLMKINRNDLIKTLQNIKPALANKEIIDQSTHFVFQRGEVRTFNDRVSINCETDDIGEFAIKAEEFFNLISALSSKEIDFEIKKNTLVIKDGKVKASLAIDCEIKLPDIELPADWIDLPKDFKQAIKFCMFSVGKTASKPALTCLSVTKKFIKSCDNFRLTTYKIEKGIKEDFLLPGEAAQRLISYNPTMYNIDDSWIHFQNEDGVIFSCRKMEVDYPDVDKLLDVDGETMELPDGLKQAIEKAGIMAVEDFELDRSIKITVSDNSLKVKGEGQIGWLEETLKVNFKGDLNMKVHPDHFIDILNKLNVVTIGKNSMLFEGEKFKHIVSLIV